MQRLSKDQITSLAVMRYGEAASDGLDAQLFCMLVDVADAYREELERIASEHPAPFFGDSTPLEALINGLRENLEIIREGK